MTKLANWNSRKSLKGKLQAHLYWNRKRRRERVLAAGGAIPDGAMTTEEGFVLTTDAGIIITEG